MNIEEFREKLIDGLNERFPGYQFSTQYVSKLNGQSYNGITGRREGEDMAPVVDIRGLFDAYEDGMPMEKAVDELEKVFGEAREKMNDISPADITNYEKMKDRLILQLIPYSGNEERLRDIPHERMSDFAVICRLELDDGNASTIVTDSLMDSFGLTKEQLFSDARENAPRLHPPILKSLMAMLFQSDEDFHGEDSPLHVATTDIGTQGACVIAYPGFLKQAAESLGGNFYVIPSSIHEVLFLRDDNGQKAEELDAMVKGVNEQEVQPGERLSDVSYHYDSESGIFERASEWEIRKEHVTEQDMAAYETSEPEVAKPETMSVLMVNAGEYPKMVEINSGLEALQEAVQGNIEVIYPYDDPVGIICNEEGKLNGMQLNRSLCNDRGEIRDILTGPFLVVGLGEEDFRSLTPEEMRKYEAVFHQPEMFVRFGRGIKSIPMADEDIIKPEKMSRQKDKTTEHDAI